MTRSTTGQGGARVREPAAPRSSRAAQRTLVIAAAGYGKTTWVTTRQATDAGCHHPADRFPVDDVDLTDPQRLVIEDLHRLSVADQLMLLTRLGERDRDLPLTLTSRSPLDAKVRALLPGPVYQIGPGDLRLTTRDVAALFREEYGLDDPALPGRAYDATAGWPTLIHLAADALVSGCPEDLVGVLGRPRSPAGVWLDTEVLGELPGDVLDLLGTLVHLDLVSTGLVEELSDATPTSWVPDAMDRLIHTGLLVRHPRAELLGRDGFRLVPLLRGLLVAPPHRPPENLQRWRRAAAWYEHRDHPFAAVEAHLRAGDVRAAHRLVATKSEPMIAQGDAAGIVSVLTGEHEHNHPALPLDDRTRGILGEALNNTGQASAAHGVLAPLVQAAETSGWDIHLAVRVAAVQFSLGQLTAARDTLDKVSCSQAPADGVGIRWWAARANVASMLGDQESATALAAEALSRAERSGAASDLAAAHQAVAKTSAGSRKAAHLALALEAAERARDAVSLARILGNQSYALLAQARCREAAEVSRLAVRATELVRPMGALIAALHNLAEALTRLGKYDEARWHLRRAAALSQRLGPNRAASSLLGLGDLHRVLGQREQGRAGYEEAVRLADTSGELQVLVPALSGLARIVVDVEPDHARICANRARALATPGLRPYALIALGWVEVVAGDREKAAELAHQAANQARADRSLDLLAEAAELAGESAATPEQAHRSLSEACSIWRDGGAEPEVWRIELLLGRLETADRAAKTRAREAADSLRRLGVTSLNGRQFGEDPVGKDIQITVLGQFAVTVAGHPVELAAWRSRQARTLVKILASRRGHPVSRTYLCDVLWPDDEPAKTSHRLSVLLTTVRSVLDPVKKWPADRYVVSDTRGVWLDLRRVAIDADDLLADAEQGAVMMATGEVATGAELLNAVDVKYGGAAFADEDEADWADVIREETRVAWLRSLRHLATLATQQGRSNDASAILTRLLNVDPYDDRVHRGLVRNLVRAGRHGEARRAFERWSAAMREVDAPAPDAVELATRPRASS